MVIVLFAALVIPLVAGVSMMAGERLEREYTHRFAWMTAMVAGALSCVCVVVAAYQHASIDDPWIPELGLRFHLVMDGISSPLVILSATVTLLAVAISSRQRPVGTPGLFYGSILVVAAGAMAAFVIRDVIGFFIAFEVVLVPMWVLINRYGSADRERASWIFVIYTAFGSMCMLLGILVLSLAAGTSDMSQLASGAAMNVSPGLRLFAAICMTIGLAVKVPMLGVHSWLPRAHTAAPTAGSMMLAAVLLKLGTYGFVRLVVLPLPQEWREIAPYIAALAVAGIIVGGLVCLVERDLKRLIAWSSIAHMGFVMLALASATTLGLQAALYGNLAHGVISALLFAVVGTMKAHNFATDVDGEHVGLRDEDPRLGFALIVGCAAALGLPGLAGFWGEILALFAAWNAPHRPHHLFEVLALVAAFGSVLAAAYCLRVLRSLWAGSGERIPPPATKLSGGPQGVHGLEWACLTVLIAAVVILGLTPSALMHFSSSALSHALGGAQ